MPYHFACKRLVAFFTSLKESGVLALLSFHQKTTVYIFSQGAD